MPQPRQTVSYLIKTFREVGLQPDSRHGQNFLIDLNLLELLARSADASSDDVILEVGTGTGSLTALLAEKAAEVITVEIDGHLHQLASETLHGLDNITLLHQDALHNKNNFDARVLEVIQQKLAENPGRKFKLAANLPYNVATPVISNLLHGDTPPVQMAITIQKELADRIVAKPDTRDYGSLSLWIQSQCDAEIVRIMPPSVFWPQPKVYSAIVKITLRPERRNAIPDLPFFHYFVRHIFLHRRKILRKGIISSYKNRLTKPQVDEIMQAMNLPADARAEQLDLATMLELCEHIRQRATGTPSD